MDIEVRQLCEWTENGDGYWETSCNRAFDFVDGSPVGNHFNFCPYCGKTLIEKPDEDEQA